ncbi:helix-turn-helix domain-containing protein [Pelagicoccus albus]|uniref:Helix-turn-helix domain-containing protein n=1 Tax=Pelagicoccus albus TaxID=415222 RepID=A0A7X1E7P1_9BACT|nr:leucine zipper domain-containing protein [Pelagicoccus albus]MBC2605479.1 helix-turn-helix domain-containing protein [Pelagicoccus albus]
MPWKEVYPMEEKLRFVTLAKTGRFHITDLCQDFGISRKTGHKYIERYDRFGLAGLGEASRRPNCSPNATDTSVERLILKEQRELKGVTHQNSNLGAMESGLCSKSN